MTDQPWLLLDVSALAYRALYSIGGDLSYGGVKTGVVFGVFKAVVDLMEIHGTSRLVWCFDRGCKVRRRVRPEYKRNRREDIPEEERQAKLEVKDQLTRMRKLYLPYAGFRNILSQPGYEADDMIAACCSEDCLFANDNMVIVSDDDDLLQLLVEDRVTIWKIRKGKPVTADSFRREKGIGPSLWADVKAIAGCPGDNVRGVDGVGEKTAIKYLAGMLPSTTKKFRAIIEHDGLHRENLLLTRLPAEGTRRVKLREDTVTKRRWDRLMEKLGIKSLMSGARSGWR